nr:sigma-54 dependent transcriptional regulator [Marinibactrum halimedae]
MLVDDNPAILEALSLLLEIHGYEVCTASGPESALKRVQSQEIHLVISDMNFQSETTSGREGRQLFYQLRELNPNLPIILMTAWANLEMAVELVKSGAADYLSKPWEDQKLLIAVQNLLSLGELSTENQRLQHVESRRLAMKFSTEANYDLCNTVFLSPMMQRVVDMAVHVAPADVPVLITGPNGAGKEKIAEIIQANSRRKSQPFIKVNVGALPADLLEAELFGAEKGAFTGSDKRRVGRFEAANGGTLFLDEMGNLSLEGQHKLLRVLQSGEFERVGSSQTQKVDVRIIAATNENLPKAIAEQRFREDLYYRLNVIELNVPPLKDRPEDILPLAEFFLSQSSSAPKGASEKSSVNAPAKSLSRQAILKMEAYHWPGNVRELHNCIQRACLLSQANEISSEDLGLTLLESPSFCVDGITREEASHNSLKRSSDNAASSNLHLSSGHSPSKDLLFKGNLAKGNSPKVNSAKGKCSKEEKQDVTLEDIQHALDQNGGVVARAARQLGISRQALYRRLAKYEGESE